MSDKFFPQRCTEHELKIIRLLKENEKLKMQRNEGQMLLRQEIQSLKQAVRELFSEIDTYYRDAKDLQKKSGTDYSMGAKDWISSLYSNFKSHPTVHRIMQEGEKK